MSGPRCIVCGKPIAKRTHTIYFRQPFGDKSAGDIDREQFSTTHYLTDRPKTKAEASRFTNGQIVSVRRGHPESEIQHVSVWDGESYQGKYFHSNECAMLQGYASAQGGHRYTWKPRP